MFKLLNNVVMLDSIINIMGTDYVKVNHNEADKLVDVDDFDISPEIVGNLRNGSSYSAALSLESDKIHAEILTEWF